MKQPKKIKKPKLPKVKLSRELRRVRSAEQKVSDALSTVPRITNETVSEHREEVLAGARKYIYPLQHSKHHIVRISVGLFAVVIISFFVLFSLSLYKFQSTSGFTYNVTRIVPFPVAKAGSSWVSYESYLFELRRNMHYYQTQQQANFISKDGKQQLKRLKEQALAQVIQDAYVKQLASQNHVSVSEEQVNNQVTLVRSQNRLGDSERVFRVVLNEFWGWKEADFKRELKQELLQQAVVAKLDDGTTAKAHAALQQLVNGADFGSLATQVSDDLGTKAAGGQYPRPLTMRDSDLSPVLAQEIFRLKPGETSSLINTGYTLDIVKVTDATDSTRHAAHIQFTFQDITTYVKPLQAKNPPHDYIKV